MARLYKITAYIVDGNERYSSGEDLLRDALNLTDDVYCPCPAEVKEIDLGWYDDLPINCIGYEKYFKEKDNGRSNNV